MKSEEIKVPFGAKDSELKGWEYTIPEGMEAVVKDGKIIVREKESEDDRIRKSLCDIVRDMPYMETELRAHGLTVEKTIAYLEKQKEQKSLNISAASEWLRNHVCSYVNSEYNEFHKCVEYDGSIDKERLINDFEKAMQKEQKPVHTAKEMWKEMRLEVYAQASGNRHEPNYSDDSTKMFSLCDIDEIFEKIGNSIVEPQHAEWSDEDEKLLNIIISDVRRTQGSCGIGTDEWNIHSKAIRWLKSRHPSWKPSKEQMDALNEIINTLAASKHPHESDYLFNILNGLKKNLQKLL